MSKTTSRRDILKAGLSGAAIAGATAAGVKSAGAATADPAESAPYLTKARTTPGKTFTPYGVPSAHEAQVKRILRPPSITPGAGGSLTPIEHLEGMITPSGLHFERHHNGVPDIDPKEHRLLIDGLVQKPLEFTLDALMRYPRISRMHFVECGGNSSANAGPTAPQVTAGGIHGLISCSEWTGVKLSALLDEAGIKPEAKWILAESGDAAGHSRSIPLPEAYEQGILVMYQNGERLRPEQGYPLRLLMPGWEGNLNIKWLHRIQLAPGPMMTKDETSKYTQLEKDGIARQFNFIQPPKSVITRPSGTFSMSGAGYYQISGITWSGYGKIAKVEVTTDGGKTWREAEMPGPVFPQCLAHFRLDWDWDGKDCIIQSRATDEKGHVQPSREAWKAQFSPAQFYQYNALQSWAIGADNSVKNVYA